MKYSLFIFILIGYVSCTQKTENLVIATAANMQFAIKDLAIQFEKETGIKCSPIIGSSGKLTAQIKEGAPFDILLSADIQYPQYLTALNLTEDEPSVYAYGQLLLLSNSDIQLTNIQILSNAKIKHIAIANPATAPYGAAAKQVLESIGIWDSIQSKLVFGESIAQTNQFIFSGAAEIGITASSILKAETNEDNFQYTHIDDTLYKPIAQSMVILNNRSGQIQKAKQFKAFLTSPKGQTILQDHGYLLDL